MNRLIELIPRSLIVIQLHESVSQSNMGPGVVGIERDKGLKLRKGFLWPLSGKESIAEIEARPNVNGVQFNGS